MITNVPDFVPPASSAVFSSIKLKSDSCRRWLGLIKISPDWCGMRGNIMTMYGPDNGAVTHIAVYHGVMAGINIPSSPA